jgi:NAD(P)H-hydrate epimerase
MLPSSTSIQTPVFSREALQAIDREAIETYQMDSVVLMENAGCSAATIILDSIDASLRSNIVVVCGSGNNGGDGYVVARHLANNACGVTLLQVNDPVSQDAKTNASICAQMEIPFVRWKFDISNATLLIDALFGTGLSRPVEGLHLEIIEAMNACETPCISLDIPSGLDCDTGVPLGHCIEAWMTISFVGLKKGFLNASANHILGEIVVSPIGCPSALLEKYAYVRT